MAASLRAGNRRIEISHADKVLFPDAALTKLDLAVHYERVATLMIRQVRDHPIAMHAFPGGVLRGGYFAKDVPEHFPAWIRRATLPKRGGTVTHVLANDAATLVYLAGQNVVTLHAWPSRADRPDEPDRLIFDLDPPGEVFAEVRAAARTLGDLLRDAGLVPYAMTTGSRGLHVVAPLRRGATFTQVRAFARAMAARLADHAPHRLTTEQRKVRRGERIFIDTGRNAYAQHAVAPYAVRPRSQAPVATPLRWAELDDRDLRPDGWTITSIPKRIAGTDPWVDFGRHRRVLPHLRERDEGRDADTD
jgi:bifunctional non-homologous end joining protein LigD